MEVLAPVEECLRGSTAVAPDSGQALLLYPQICLMELQLLANSCPDLDVLSHILRSLLGALKMHHSNAALIYQQVAHSLPFKMTTNVNCSLMLRN